jgi:predicted CoA-substrate-specific enzyme activase
VYKAIGMCLGASTINIAEKSGDVIEFSHVAHDGKVAKTFHDILSGKLPAKLGITGRKFRNLVSIPTVSEPEAIELAYESLNCKYPDIDCIVSAGAETFIAYRLDSKGRIQSVQTGNKCASGTGEFFLQQIKRMGLTIADAFDMAETEEPCLVAGRCSVFCKSDCTHALNKGVPKKRISAGLCHMMAGKIIELLKVSGARRILVTGGVSRIRTVVKYLREVYPETFTATEAPSMEALGALIWAEKNSSILDDNRDLIATTHSSFPFLPDLRKALSRVSFKSMPKGEFYDGDYILGLDVGSTTTKAVLIRTDNHAICASIYLRTNGDPVSASRSCYQAIIEQYPGGLKPRIVGLGTTGSGRQISGLHAMTPGIVNEIVAHASAAVFFDPEVETIFEIGGQDAKYTCITNRVASDYAMNEACSAGTGSFLEEACFESLGIKTEEIADIALQASNPPNFSDQCAAFISSDIKTAVQEGIGREDIVAGLVYSVCQNYLNRVKGTRPIGKKVFMQGGVCYNSAVPIAMASLCSQEVIVPPEPGLMGAFGVALEIHRKIENKLMEKQVFDLEELASREVVRHEPFICGGGRENCDRKCSIARLSINGKIYPFGGACDKYYNLLGKKEVDTCNLDFVKIREDLVFRKYAPLIPGTAPKITVGIPASLLSNTFYPLYAHFFTNLGVGVIPGETPDPRGIEATGAAFCYPVALSHGFLKTLLERDVDYIFVPHVKNLALETSRETNCTCPFVQAEPYYLKAAFYDRLQPKLISSVLDFDNPGKLVDAFVEIARQMGFSRKKATAAFTGARRVFDSMREEMLEYGREFLRSLDDNEYAIVLFGRPYNAFSRFGNMGIPHKFASRGFKVLPHDFLPMEELGGATIDQMFWASGQGIMQAAHYVHMAQNLFGVFITNFSCGPDSFINGYFRDAMGQKPSLTLELDAHTADAGVDTRIEAFLDVIRGFRELKLSSQDEKDDFEPCRLILSRGKYLVRASDGREYPLTDPRVHLLVPSMGDTASKCLAAAMRFAGLNASALEPPGQTEMNLGKGLATCKECLPLILTAGSLVKYMNENVNRDEIVVYFMPETDGPCRFGQYNVFLKNLIRKDRVRNVAIMSLSAEDSYAGISSRLSRRAWLALTISDGLDDIYSAILALSSDATAAMENFEKARVRIIESIARDDYSTLIGVVREEMRNLSSLDKKKTVSEATRISLIGEIYVRRDAFSRQNIVEKLAKHEIVVKTAPITEWLYYTDYCLANGISAEYSLKAKFNVLFKSIFMRKDERIIKECMSLSGFYEKHEIDMKHLMDRGAGVISPQLSGEAILTISSALTEVGDDTHGVISIGPFGCMPCRIAESIVGYRLVEEKENFSRDNGKFWSSRSKDLPLPFLAIESDGNPFPQLVETRLESLLLSANRLKEELMEIETAV